MCRDIDVPNSQIYQVGKRIEMLKSARSLFDHTDNAIDAFSHCVSKAGFNECQDIFKVILQFLDKGTYWFEAASQSATHPSFDEVTCRTGVSVIPELFELIQAR